MGTAVAVVNVGCFPENGRVFIKKNHRIPLAEDLPGNECSWIPMKMRSMELRNHHSYWLWISPMCIESRAGIGKK